MLRTRCIFTIAFLITMVSSQAQNFTGGYHFFLPPDDSTTQVFLPTFPPREIQSFIGIDPEGHFTSEGSPIRFWGVNTTTHACFPSKSKSPFIAARMRKMGINLVRFHHMDNGWTDEEGTIFLKSSGGTRQLDPVALDRLFFLLAEMKKNSVYANINLHVSRTFTEADGILNADSIWQFAKGITMFDPQLIELQKEFARQLLTEENPYTGLAMTNDPVMAMVEISNENTLYGMWKSDQLKPFVRGGDLMQRHASLLNDKWQVFLQNKYGADEALAAAWGGSQNGNSENMITDGGFELGSINAPWALELFEGAAATVDITGASPHSGNYAAAVEVSRVTNTGWHIQFVQRGLSFEQDSAYVLDFYAKADRNRSINAGIQRNNSPYTWYGGQGFDLSTQWQRFRFSVTAPENNPGQVKVTFNFANQTGTVWFDDVKLSKPQLSGLEAGEQLSAKNIRRVDYSERLLFHPQRVADMAEFYLEIQRSYFKEMYDYLKDDLGVQVPITGTNALVGPSDVYTQQDLDYIDDHSYWDHPRFPNTAWSSTDWYINNESMLTHEQLGTIPNLFAGQAIQGRPYTISEYNHAFPNSHQLEMLPVLTSYASFHDADGLMFFNYNDGSEWEEDFIDGYFSVHRNNTLMSMFPLYAQIYRNNYITSDAEPILVRYDRASVFKLPQQDNNGRWGKFFPYDRKIALERSIRTMGFTETTTQLPDLESTSQSTHWTNSEEVGWNQSNKYHLINNPKIQVLSGDLPNYTGGPLDQLELLSASDAGVISWLSLDEKDLETSAYSLLAVNSRIQNRNMAWDGITTVHNQWGNAPTEILGLKLSLALQMEADFIRVFPLDSKGGHSNDNYFTFWPKEAGRFEISIDQSRSPTPWFGIQAVKSPTSTRDQLLSGLEAKLSPNPGQLITQLSFKLKKPSAVQIEVFDLFGKKVLSHGRQSLPAGEQQQQLKMADLPAGVYVVSLQTPQGVWSEKWVKE